jgi:hypothetical protein
MSGSSRETGKNPRANTDSSFKLARFAGRVLHIVLFHSPRGDMIMRILLASLLLGFLVAGCQKSQEGGESKGMGMESGGKSMESESMGVPSSAHGKTVDGTFYPDHAQDLKEFRLRSSLSGVERMIEQYKKDGYDTSDLESRKAELENQLSNMTG